MKLVRKMKYASPVVLLSLLFAAPALAQFEVSPDHFDNSQATNKTKPVQKAKTHQTATNKTMQSVDGKLQSSTNTAAVANSTSQASQPAGRANATSTVARASGTTAAKLQGQGKTQRSRPAQRLSANAAPAPRE